MDDGRSFPAPVTQRKVRAHFRPQETGETHSILSLLSVSRSSHADEVIESSGEANYQPVWLQNVTDNSLREKPEEWLPCLAHKLKHSKRVS